MKTPGSRIRALRIKLNLSQDEVAKQMGYSSRSSINKIEVEGRSIPSDKLETLAQILHTTPAYIMGWQTSEALSIPLYEGLSCGYGSYVDEKAIDYIGLPSGFLKPNKEYFANYASGDSMIDRNIQDGDLMIFERCQTLEDGQVGSFILNEDDATCKIFKHDASGNVVLMPANEQYDPIIIDSFNESFRIVGKLAYVVSKRSS